MSDDYSVPTAAFTPAEFRAWEALEERQAGILQGRQEHYRIDRVPFQPTGDDTMVFRLRPKEQQTESGIIMPDHSLHVDTDERGQRTVTKSAPTISMGILLNAGCGARDWLRAHGVLVGDIIRWGKFSGEEESVHWFSGGTVRALTDVLLLNVRDVRGSFDLDNRLVEGMAKIVYVADPAGNGMHIVKPIVKE